MNRDLVLSGSDGVTLVEVLVYLALYALLMTGAFSAAYSFSESGEHNETSAFVAEEGMFLVGKVNWALSNAVSVQSPQASGTALEVTRSGGMVIRIRGDGSALRMQVGDSDEQQLNSSNVAVSNTVFVRMSQPDSISSSFTISATTSDGHAVSGDFSTLDYLGP